MCPVKDQRAENAFRIGLGDRHQHLVVGDVTTDGGRVGPQYSPVEDVHHVGEVPDRGVADFGHRQAPRASSTAASRSSTLGRSNVDLLR